MRKLLMCLLFAAAAHAGLAQQASLQGKVTDTLEKKNLQYAVISLLRGSDSTLFQFVRSDERGGFVFTNIPSGKYLLLVTYPKFADFADEIDVKPGSNDLGHIAMTLKARLLDAVIVRNSGAIRIKGDTTEFVADSFHVREGATVEDLLKKFPGFQVNSKGEITAQGKRVDKVLVDGEEFFGDDPTMATQNLSSKAVEKVQLFDTHTDEQNLTGIAGSSNTKTLNIKLKDEFKKGSFGKVEAASNLKKLHDAKLLYNRFHGKEKLSFYGTKSNTTSGNISWQDRNKFGLDNNDDFEYDDVGGFFYSFSEGDEFSDWNLRGLPDAYTAGGVYVNKWDNERQTVNGSYLYNRLGTDNQDNVLTKSILPDSVLYTQKSTTGHSLLQQHAPNFKYIWKPDSLTTVTFKSNNTYKTNETVAHTFSETQTEDLAPLNTSSRSNNNSGTKKNSDNQLSYKRLFKKTGRQLTASARYTYNENQEDNFILSDNRFFKNGTLLSHDSTDQEKLVRSHSGTLGASFSYNEPLTTKWNLVVLGSYNHNNSTAHLNTFDKSSNGKYESFSPLYSNNFDYTAEGLSGTALLKYVTKKLTLVGGSGVSTIAQHITDLDSNSRNVYHFNRMLPQFQFRYSPKAQTFLGFSYRGATQQPTIEQLQPLRNNSDPLNIYIGNPNLKTGFNQRFNLNLGEFKILSQRYMYLSIDYSTVSNAVTTASYIDSLGRKVSTNVNVNGNRNWQLWGMWNKQRGDGKWNFGTNANANAGRSVTFVNGSRSVNKYTQYNIYFNVNKNIENKWNVSFNPTFGQSFSSSSLQPDNKTKYITWGGSSYCSLTFLKKFEVISDINATLRQRISAADTHPNVFLWNARLSRKLFKKDVGKISIIANDLLNQNKGVNRLITSNFVTDERYLQVSRYFQLKFEWSFNNNPGSK